MSGTGGPTQQELRAVAHDSLTSETSQGAAPLFAADEPPPWHLINDEGAARTLLVCDHASRRIPRSLNDLGLDRLALRRHIACDIGAGEVTRRLSRMLDAPALLANYSRLVVDCNRRLNDPTAFLAVSDGEFIPGNHNLTAEAKALRADTIFHPYHAGIRDRLARFREAGITPAFIAIHSFTPIFNGTSRPWQIGYTIDHHAEPAGMPHVSIEIRQDLISTSEGAERWSLILGRALAEILEDDELYSVLDGVAVQ
jgi:predicted N-formylglutamate amidohydrolase